MPFDNNQCSEYNYIKKRDRWANLATHNRLDYIFICYIKPFNFMKPIQFS